VQFNKPSQCNHDAVSDAESGVEEGVSGGRVPVEHQWSYSEAQNVESGISEGEQDGYNDHVISLRVDVDRPSGV